jgi:D-alanyl-D-alanine carboxypeptidase
MAFAPSAVLAHPDGPAALPTPVATPVPTARHEVAPGETLRLIAERYDVPIEELIAANSLLDPDLIGVGAVLTIPGVTPDEAAGTTAPAPPPVLAQTAATSESPKPAPEPVPTVPGPRRISDAPPPAVSARYIAVVDEASGQLLYGQDEHARVAPASITKILTTLVALEAEPNLARRIPITISGAEMNRRDGSSIMGIEPGLELSLSTLLYGIMLPSGNDAAEQVALAIAGSREAFVGRMNQKVAQLGLKDSQFLNPSGMDANGHYSSAYDMAMLGREAMELPTFRQLARAKSFAAEGFNLTNLNRLIGRYAEADGIKIGSTPRAGRTIVASATRNGHRVYVALLRCDDLPGDSEALFDWVWDTFEW